MNIIRKTFKEYIGNFREIFAVMMPMFVLQLIVGVLVQAGLFVADVFQTDVALLIALGLGIIGVIVTCVMLLVYIPATLKVFQRREEGESITISEALLSQKTWPQIWSFIRVTFYTWSATIFYIVISIIPGLLCVAIIEYFDLSDTRPLITATLFVIALCSGVYFLLRNMTKIIYVFNVYVSSKGYTAWQSIKESIRLGKTYRAQAWGAVFGVVLIGVLGNCIQLLLTFLLSPHQFMEQMNHSLYVPDTYFIIGTTIIAMLTSVLFISALMYSYLSKKYQQVRALDEKNVC